MIRFMFTAFLVGLFCCTLNAQGAIGQIDWLLIDEDREDREIPCMVWYPAMQDGSETPPLSGPFPTVVLAHGFAMGPADYEGLAEGLVEEGYVFVSLGTELGFAANHAMYGLDLAFVSNAVADGDVSGLLENVLNGRVAIAGHSMGGGAAWLAAAEQPVIDAVVALAPAETSPSALAVGSEMSVPLLVISGSGDAVTPPSTQHTPLYESAVNSPCRAFVSIADGGHCGFADPGTLCDFGELGFNGLPHAEQLEMTLGVTIPWLDAFLKDDLNGLDALDAFAAEVNVNLELACSLQVEEVVSDKLDVHPNPGQGGGYIRNASMQQANLEVYNARGQRVVAGLELAPGQRVELRLSPGMHIAKLRIGAEVEAATWIIL